MNALPHSDWLDCASREEMRVKHAGGLRIFDPFVPFLAHRVITWQDARSTRV